MSEEDVGDVSDFESPQHLEVLLQGIDQHILPKPEIAKLIEMLGFDDISEFFIEENIVNPAERDVYSLFADLYRVVFHYKIFSQPQEVPAGYPFLKGCDLDGENYLLFLKDKRLVNYIDFS